MKNGFNKFELCKGIMTYLYQAAEECLDLEYAHMQKRLLHTIATVYVATFLQQPPALEGCPVTRSYLSSIGAMYRTTKTRIAMNIECHELEALLLQTQLAVKHAGEAYFLSVTEWEYPNMCEFCLTNVSNVVVVVDNNGQQSTIRDRCSNCIDVVDWGKGRVIATHTIRAGVVTVVPSVDGEGAVFNILPAQIQALV